MDGFREAVRDLEAPAAADLLESESAYVLVVDLPGATPDRTTVTARGETLSITAERAPPIPEDAEVLREERPRILEVRLPLPPDARVDQATASLTDGVLEVELPRVGGQPAVQIEE